MKYLCSFFTLVIISLTGNISFAEFVVPQAPARFVYDEMGILSNEEKTTLETRVLEIESRTKHQIGIAIISSLKGRPIEEVGLTIGRMWGIGHTGVDNGLLILVAPNERETRIEVGRGLEGVITDLIANRVIDEWMIPEFREENYFEGLQAALEVMDPLVSGEKVDLPETKGAGSISLVFAIIWFCAMFIGVFASSKSWWLGGILGGFGGIILFSTNILMGLFSGIIFGLLVDFLVSKFFYRPFMSGGSRNKWWGGGGGGGFGGFGGSSGGFGGGGFGGGGASGKW